METCETWKFKNSKKMTNIQTFKSHKLTFFDCNQIIWLQHFISSKQIFLTISKHNLKKSEKNHFVFGFCRITFSFALPICICVENGVVHRKKGMENQPKHCVQIVFEGQKCNISVSLEEHKKLFKIRLSTEGIDLSLFELEFLLQTRWMQMLFTPKQNL